MNYYPNHDAFKNKDPQDLFSDYGFIFEVFSDLPGKLAADLANNTEVAPAVTVFADGAVLLSKQICDVICGEEDLVTLFAEAHGFEVFDFSHVLEKLIGYYNEAYELLNELLGYSDEDGPVDGLVEIFEKATKVHAAFLEDFNVLMEEKMDKAS